jgi:hypothetical protein
MYSDPRDMDADDMCGGGPQGYHEFDYYDNAEWLDQDNDIDDIDSPEQLADFERLKKLHKLLALDKAIRELKGES